MLDSLSVWQLLLVVVLANGLIMAFAKIRSSRRRRLALSAISEAVHYRCSKSWLDLESFELWINLRAEALSECYWRIKPDPDHPVLSDIIEFGRHLLDGLAACRRDKKGFEATKRLPAVAFAVILDLFGFPVGEVTRDIRERFIELSGEPS